MSPRPLWFWTIMKLGAGQLWVLHFVFMLVKWWISMYEMMDIWNKSCNDHINLPLWHRQIEDVFTRCIIRPSVVSCSIVIINRVRSFTGCIDLLREYHFIHVLLHRFISAAWYVDIWQSWRSHCNGYWVQCTSCCPNFWSGDTPAEIHWVCLQGNRKTKATLLNNISDIWPICCLFWVLHCPSKECPK